MNFTQLRHSLLHTLRGDVVLSALLGRDEQGQPQVYETLAPNGVRPPYLTFALVPTGAAPEGHFGDSEAIKFFGIQLSSWGRTKDETWQINEAAHEAMMRGDWSVDLKPDYRLQIASQGNQQELEDPTTRLIYVPETFRLTVAR